MPLSVGDKLGPYEILAAIGAGGMGEVYRARDSKLNRDVAIKVLPAALAGDAQYMARFEREAQVLASLNDSNIATVYGIEQGALVMELVEGADLKGPLPLAEAIAIARQIAAGLEAAHERGIIHRDLKPANIKLTPAGVVKILDFGLAKTGIEFATGSPDSSPTMSPTLSLAMTKAGMIIGTAAYMSPEQARGKPVDKRADIWAFGVVLYELLTGKMLFGGGETVTDTLASVVKDVPDLNALPAGTPLYIRALLERCLRKDVKMRLRDVGEARIVLESPGGTEVPWPSKPRVTKLPWVVAALAILLAAAVSFLRFRETPPAEAALRLSVPLPDKSAITYLALSPDGRTVAFSASLGNRSGLWLRALDSLELRPLSNIDSPRHPFWSPDGRFLGFFADGKLQVISATGGPATALCDAGTGAGGAWNREGVILFGTDNGPIQRVNAGGGVCSPVTQAQPGERHRLPTFLPDGRHFLYLVQNTDPRKAGVYLAALDQPAGHRLLPDRSSAIFAPRRKGESHDHLLFQRENTLMAQPFNAATLQLEGDPFLVAPQLSRTTTPTQVAASVAANGTLVYLAGSSRSEAQPVWLDRDGKELGKVRPMGDFTGLALSPDQKFVALTGSSLQPGLWLHELARDVETRFTLPPLVGPPIWSPDSRRIAFSGQHSLYVKSASGGQEQLLLQSGNPTTPADWSRDGKYLLYTEIDPKTRGDIWYLTLDASGKPAAPVVFLKTGFNESQGQFSPDGRWVAYFSNESGQSEVYVRPFPSGGALTKISSDGGDAPRWRGDGKELYYLKHSGTSYSLIAVSVQSPSGGPLTAGVPKALFEMHSRSILPENNIFDYSPSADGRRFLVYVLSDATMPTLNVITNWEKLASGR